MNVYGLLISLYDGTSETKEKLERQFGVDTVKECISKNYIKEDGINQFNIKLYRITTIGKAAYDNKLY